MQEGGTEHFDYSKHRLGYIIQAVANTGLKESTHELKRKIWHMFCISKKRSFRGKKTKACAHHYTPNPVLFYKVST